MVQVRTKTGWQCWDLLRDITVNDGAPAGRVKPKLGAELRIPIDSYRSLQIPLKKSREREMLGAVRCMREGKEEAILHAETTRYRLVITGSGDGREGSSSSPNVGRGVIPFSLPGKSFLSSSR